MWKVIFGAVIVGFSGAIIGTGVGDMTGRQTQTLCIMIGVGAGAVVGAIAGAVSAIQNPGPVPRWVWTAVIVFFLFAVFWATGVNMFFLAAKKSADERGRLFRPMPAVASTPVFTAGCPSTLGA